MLTRNIINAVVKNDLIELQKELDFFKFNLNEAIGKTGQRLLHIAIKQGNERVFLFLLIQPFIDINITDYSGNTPAHYAVIFEQPNLLKFLKDAGADFSLKNNGGHTLNDCIQVQPKSEQGRRIKQEFEKILMGFSDLAKADLEDNPKKIPSTSIQTSDLAFFDHTDRPIEPLDLTKHDKPLNF